MPAKHAELQGGAGAAAMFARLSASRGSQGPVCAFAGGALPTTLLSSCATALLPMLSSAAVLPLRTCAAFTRWT